MTSNIIIANKLRKNYKDFPAVKGIDFVVPEGSGFGLLGPNGAGKTTILKMIYGKCLQDNCSDSKLSVFGMSPCYQSLAIKSLCGIVPQDNNLDEELNVETNLLVFAGFHGLAKVGLKNKISSLLDFMELGNKRKAKIKELSGGMQRRLIIARALLNNPKLLILDEPTTGLDPQARHVIWDKLHQLRSQGVTLLLTTHYMEEAFQLCSHILILHQGKKILEGDPKVLLQEHIERYVLEIYDRGFSSNDLDPALRIEKTEERFLVYHNSLSLLEKVTEKIATGKYYLRQANLEDLFLKMTGRDLHED